MSVAAIVVAAGRGSRIGGDVPKQYRSLDGRPVLARALEAFLTYPEIASVQAVIHPGDRAAYEAAIHDLSETMRAKLTAPVLGGATRQASVRNGLEALAGSAEPPAIVLIHDAARPFVDADLIGRAVAAARTGAAVPGVPVTDTIKIVDETGLVTGTPPRPLLRAVQTPQAFPFAMILAAHRAAAAAGLDTFTDDAAVAEWAGFPVTVFAGDPRNAKLTHPADFAATERPTTDREAMLITRTGTGFDVHAFGEGDHVWLGGVRIAHERGTIAHSDGDVILHALTDAVLGALADGDIGVHFPPSDPQWRGASSDRFLAFAVERVRARGGIVDHLDATLLCEAPRLGPHREAIRARIAAIADVPVAAVSVKATTTERLGFTGRAEGIAAQAAATVRLPERDI